MLEDSLGKRLFQNENHPIYIEDENLSQQLESQMSLNISFSNDESKGHANNISYFQPPCKKSSKNEDESLYFRLNQLSEVKSFQREPQLSQEI